jgi:tetratricopeptide (TPR) repeat protein
LRRKDWKSPPIPENITHSTHVRNEEPLKVGFVRKPWFWLVVLLIVVGATYLPGLRGGFVNDDRRLVQDRAVLFATPGAYRVLPLRVFWWGTPYDENAWRYYRPLVSLTYWLEYQWGGLNPFIYHLSNWLVHLANTLLVFLVMRALVGNGFALGISALTALCPAALTSVGWISGRTDLWATFFVLLFLLAFRAARKTRSAWPHIAASAAYFGGLASKEVAIVAPIIAWALDRGSPKQSTAEEETMRPLWHHAVLVIPLAIYLLLRRIAAGNALPSSLSLFTFLQSIPYLAEQYLQTLFSILVPLHYNFFVDLLWSLPGQRGATFFLGWFIFLVLILLVVIGLRRRQLWAVGGFWAGIVLFPAYALNRSFAPVADFYAYLALPGFWLFVVDGLRVLALQFSLRTKAVSWSLGSAITVAVIVFAILTIHRLPLLASDISLWSHMARRAPSSEMVALNLSEAYHMNGEDEKAFRWTVRAAALDSTRWEPQNNLANYFLDRGDIYGAAPHVDALAVLAPDRFEAQATIARFYYIAGACSLAVMTYQRAFTMGPPTANTLLGYANALFCVQDYQDAVETFQLALRWQPNWAPAYHNMALAYKNLGQFDEAIAAQEEALRLDSTLLSSRESLAVLHLLKGDSLEARRAASDYIAHNPPAEEVQNLLETMAQAGMDTTSLRNKESEK